MISFGCPNCGQHYDVDDRRAGEVGKCPKCNGDLVVPDRPAKPHIDAKSFLYGAGCGVIICIAFALKIMGSPPSAVHKSEPQRLARPSTPSRTVPASQPLRATTDKPTAHNTDSTASPRLELIDWRIYRELNYLIVEGRVKNLSSSAMQSVWAAVTWTDAEDEFITSESGPIDLQPVMPQQISTFKMMAKYNPAMAHSSIEFREGFGGTIETKNLDKAPRKG